MFGIKAKDKKLDVETSGSVAKVVYGGNVSRACLKKACDMANGAFADDYAVSLGVVDSWLAKDSESVLIGLDEEGKVAAYASVFLITRGIYNRIIRGEICDWDMSEIGPNITHQDDVDAFFYVGAVVVREDLRGSEAFKVMREAIMGQLVGKAAGRDINVCCEIMAEKAKIAAEKMGLTRVTQALDGFPLYAGKIHN